MPNPNFQVPLCKKCGVPHLNFQPCGTVHVLTPYEQRLVRARSFTRWPKQPPVRWRTDLDREWGRDRLREGTLLMGENTLMRKENAKPRYGAVTHPALQDEDAA